MTEPSVLTERLRHGSNSDSTTLSGELTSTFLMICVFPLGQLLGQLVDFLVRLREGVQRLLQLSLGLE